MKISTARKPAAPKKAPAAKKKTAKKAAAPAAKKLGGYIAPRRPVSSGGEGASASTFTPAYVPVSSGGEGGGGGGYAYVPTYSSGVSYGGE